MTSTASSKRSTSSLGSGKGMPSISCSGAYRPAPNPSSSRLFEMWSTVAASLASHAGWRNVFELTRQPIRIRSVPAARAARSVQASK